MLFYAREPAPWYAYMIHSISLTTAAAWASGGRQHMIHSFPSIRLLHRSTPENFYRKTVWVFRLTLTTTLG